RWAPNPMPIRRLIRISLLPLRAAIIRYNSMGLHHRLPACATGENQMRNALRLAVLLLLIAAAAAAEDHGFRTLVKGGTSGAAGEVVIRAPQQWQRFWAEHCRVLDPRPPPPKVDFNREMVVAVFEREVTDVRPEDGALVVYCRKLDLPPDVLEASREPH